MATSLWKPPPASPRLTRRRSWSGEWAVGWGPHCSGGGMVSGCGPVGCRAARPKPGGWGAVVVQEVQMTWLTWRERGALRGSHPTGRPQMHPHPHLGESAIGDPFLSLWNAGPSSLSMQVTAASHKQCPHTRWRAQRVRRPPGSAAAWPPSITALLRKASWYP